MRDLVGMLRLVAPDALIEVGSELLRVARYSDVCRHLQRYDLESVLHRLLVTWLMVGDADTDLPICLKEPVRRLYVELLRIRGPDLEHNVSLRDVLELEHRSRVGSNVAL